jgi:ABC-type sulfate transport system substrate-binding protein
MKTFFKILVPLAFSLAVSAGAKDIKLLNVSYDPTRELYQDYNAAFARYWKAKTGDNVAVARRLRQTGAVRHQWSRSRRGDARAGLRH